MKELESSPMDVVDTLQITRDSYQAYGDHVEWKNYQGHPMPPFEALPDAIKGAWHASVLKTIDSYERATTITEKIPSTPAPPPEVI